jgi:hypothetical protein
MAEQSQEPGECSDGRYLWVPRKQHALYDETLYILWIHTATIQDIFSDGYFITHPKIYLNPEVKKGHKPQTELAYDNELIPWSTVFPQKLTAPQLAKNFPVFYGTWWLIAVFNE